LKIRTNAIDNNEIVQQQLAELTKMVSDLEQLHKRGFVSIDLLTPLRNSFNSAFTALVKLQLALKRGKK
jgi:glycerol-3-phosphate responsive antiterminator